MIITDKEQIRERFIASLPTELEQIMVGVDMGDFQNVINGARTYVGFEYESNDGFTDALYKSIEADVERYIELSFNAVLINIVVASDEMAKLEDIRRLVQTYHSKSREYCLNIIWGITYNRAFAPSRVEIAGVFALSF